MSYLMIENNTECPIEGFTKLGVSSHRDNADCIGQFGSGVKMAVLTLLRHNIKPVCYVGTGKIEYETERKLMQRTQYTDVYAKLSGKFGNRRQELGFSLEYGAQDWTKIDYALREFISNAFDQSDVKGTNIAIVDDTRAKKGTTRIFIPCTDEIQNYIDNIDYFFLQFKGKHKDSILPKSGKNMRIYRKGVYVTEFDYNSLFDYNFNSQISIDESRNLKNFNFSSIGQLLDENATKTILHAVVDNKDTYEVKYLNYWDLDCKKMAQVFQQIYPNYTVASTPEQLSFAKNKGINAVLVNQNWETILNYGGIKKVKEMMHDLENQGCTIIEPTQNIIKQTENVWKQIQNVGMTNNKDFPTVMAFKKPVDQNNLLLGFVDKNNVVYLNVDVVNKKTILEELAHYITGAGDGTKDFEDFIIRFAASLLK